MRCPACEEADTKVVDSRSSDDGESIRRRRECLRCGHRFTTYERLGERPVIVIKSDGSAEAFDQEKLMRGVLIACAKRPVTPDQIERLVASIEAELRALPKGEVRSCDLGDMALARLAGLDDVAYIRFASVYKDFQNVEEFSRALKDLR
ncbi:MAG: transcriptional repressor NrdR [Eggerthellaceae bacterium]|jgi:transcriptional repressor NrdR|nr:transcriptional repressor NrdR [Eggerthellaceae bacterium]